MWLWHGINRYKQDSDRRRVFRNREPYRVAANRVDTALLSGALVLLAFAAIAKVRLTAVSCHDTRCDCGNAFVVGQHDGEASTGITLRLSTILPALRLFTSTVSARRLLMGVMKRVPEFLLMIVLLALLLYFFAAVGVYLFSGVMSAYPSEFGLENNPSFDSLGEGFGVLVQMLFGQNVGGIMFTAVDGTDNLTSSIYFVIFISIMTVIFSNVLVALVIDAWLVSTPSLHVSRLALLLMLHLPSYYCCGALGQHTQRFEAHRVKRKKVRVFALCAARRVHACFVSLLLSLRLAQYMVLHWQMEGFRTLEVWFKRLVMPKVRRKRRIKRLAQVRQRMRTLKPLLPGMKDRRSPSPTPNPIAGDTSAPDGVPAPGAVV